jgi:hypothetical protein
MQKSRRPAAQRNRRTTRTSLTKTPGKAPAVRKNKANPESSVRQAAASRTRKRGGLLMAAGLASGAAALIYSWFGRVRRKEHGASTVGAKSRDGDTTDAPSARKPRSKGPGGSSRSASAINKATKADSDPAPDRPAPSEAASRTPRRRAKPNPVDIVAGSTTSQPENSVPKRGRSRKNPIEGTSTIRSDVRKTRGPSGAVTTGSEAGATSGEALRNSPSPLLSQPTLSPASVNEEPTIAFAVSVDDASLTSAAADDDRPTGHERGKGATNASVQEPDSVDAE